MGFFYVRARLLNVIVTERRRDTLSVADVVICTDDSARVFTERWKTSKLSRFLQTRLTSRCAHKSLLAAETVQGPKMGEFSCKDLLFSEADDREDPARLQRQSGAEGARGTTTSSSAEL